MGGAVQSDSFESSESALHLAQCRQWQQKEEEADCNEGHGEGEGHGDEESDCNEGHGEGEDEDEEMTIDSALNAKSKAI